MRSLRFAALAAVVSAVAAAHGFCGVPDGPYWSELPLPAGFSGNVKAIGTLVTFQANNDVWLWSAITRKWTTIPTSGGATVAVFNDYATILDGNVLHGYSTRFGVDTLVLAATPTLQSGPATSSWVSIARLGTDVYGFGAFQGKWKHQVVASASPTISIAQTTGIVYDGAVAYGFSAYHGNFVPIAAPGATFVSATGDLAMANGGTTVRGYSCHHDTWSSATFAGATPSAFLRDFALFVQGADVLAYSGLTGGFATYHATNTASPAVSTDNTVAAVFDGDTIAGYTAAIDGFTTQAFTAPGVTIDDDLFVVTTANGLTGFSGVTGKFSPTIPGTFPTLLLKEAMAYASNASVAYGYSVVKNVWVQAPSLPLLPVVLRGLAVGVYASAWAGFSGRTGTWVVASTSSPFDYSATASGDVFLGFDGNVMSVFDPVLLRWTPVETAGPVTFDTWRQTVVASDGTTAYGMGLMNNVWDTVAMQGSFVSLDANDACGYALTTTHLYAYPGHGSLSSDSRWPEFSRFQPIGTDLPLHQRGEAGSSVLTFVGIAPAELPAPPYGTFYVDPTVLVMFGLGTIPASGVLDVDIAVPALPALNGITLHIQDVVTTPSNHTYLTSSIAPVLL